MFGAQIPVLVALDEVPSGWGLASVDALVEALAQAAFLTRRAQLAELNALLKQPALAVVDEKARVEPGEGAVVGVAAARSGADAVTSLAGLIAALYRGQGRLAGRAEPSRQLSNLVERAQSAELISRFAQDIATQITLPGLVSVAVARTRELCEADGASLLLVDPETGQLCFDVVVGEAQTLEKVWVRPGQGIAGQVAVRAAPRLVEDAKACSDFDPSFDRLSGFCTGSVVAVPLTIGGDVIGVLQAVRSVDNVPFRELHLRRLVDLGPHVAVAVTNAQAAASLRETQLQVLSANASLEKKVEERTQMIVRAKKEWERTFDAISAPIALQSGFVIKRTNLAYARQVGLKVTEVPGKTCHQVLAGRDAPCPGCPLTVGRGGACTGEVALPNDTIMRFSTYWMNEDPADSTVVVHYQDVTQERVLQEKVREGERLAAIGQLASGAAHEINNPLGFLTANLRTLLTTMEDGRALADAVASAHESLDKGLRAEALAALEGLKDVDFEAFREGSEIITESLDGARRVADIVKALRELSKLEIGRLEACSVNSCVARAVRAELSDGGPHIETDLKETGAVRVIPLQLDQALRNILRNARQAVSGTQRIYVRTFEVDGRVRIEVQDEGCGIPKENLRRIFEPFFSTRGVGKGMGLGLTAAYGIIRRVGGQIDVASEVGKGSTFTLTFPRVEAEVREPSIDTATVANA